MLGSFQTLMNVLGAIGTLMQGTGLANIFEEIFGENAVKLIMTEESVQRAFRGHLLPEKCFSRCMCRNLYLIVSRRTNFRIHSIRAESQSAAKTDREKSLP